MVHLKQKAMQLQAGAAQVDITPKAGIQLSGSIGLHRPAQLVGDPLYAKALVLKCNGRKLCFVTLDLTFITRHYSTQIRQAAVEKFGFEYDAVMVHSLQIHSAPTLGHIFLDKDFKGIPPQFDRILRGSDDRYNPFAVEKIIEAIRLANKSLQTVQVGVGSGIEGRMAFNRRAVMRDGTISMPGFWKSPLGPTGICYIEGPMDPELGVMCMRTDSLYIPAMLVNYTCHPVVVYSSKGPYGHIVSADWPGGLAGELREAYGKETVPLVLNGACGNINPWSAFDPDYGKRDDCRMGGRVLAEMAKKVVETMTFKEGAVLDWRVMHLKIPIREIDHKELEEARKILAEHPQPVWDNEERVRVDRKWMYAALLFSVYLEKQRGPELDYEIQVFRIGDTAFVGLPGEPFVEGGLRIKLASPTYPTYIVHAINHYAGYIPTREVLEGGGHEVKTTTWSKLVPEALDMIVDTAVDLLKEMFKK